MYNYWAFPPSSYHRMWWFKLLRYKKITYREVRKIIGSLYTFLGILFSLLKIKVEWQKLQFMEHDMHDKACVGYCIEKTPSISQIGSWKISKTSDLVASMVVQLCSRSEIIWSKANIQRRAFIAWLFVLKEYQST